MKKKKQQTRNLIILAVVTVGIVLGLWAMKSNFGLNSKAAYDGKNIKSKSCKPSGQYYIFYPANNKTDNKTAGMPVCRERKIDEFGSYCGNRKVAMNFCVAKKY